VGGVLGIKCVGIFHEQVCARFGRKHPRLGWQGGAGLQKSEQ
jgi:hypothetical protein